MSFVRGDGLPKAYIYHEGLSNLVPGPAVKKAAVRKTGDAATGTFRSLGKVKSVFLSFVLKDEGCQKY